MTFHLTRLGKIAIISALVLAFVVGLRVADPAPIAELRSITFDNFQRLAPRQYGDPPVRVIDIDNETLDQFGQWPWPRTKVADLVARLASLGAAAIVLDVIFAEPDRTSPSNYLNLLQDDHSALGSQAQAVLSRLPDHDQRFAEIVRQAPVVLGYATTEQPNPVRPLVKSGYAVAGASPAEILRPFQGSVTNLPILDEAASGIGSLSLGKDSASGVIRQIPMVLSDGDKTYSSLALEALRVAQGASSITIRGTGASREQDMGRPALVDLRVGQFPVPLTAEGELFLYFDHNRPERIISAKDVWNTAHEATIRSRVEGSIVFIGTSAAGLHDRRVTPLGETVAGVTIHAQAVEQIISQDFLRRPDWAKGLEIIIAAVGGIIVAGLLVRLKAGFAGLVIAGTVGVLIGGAWLTFLHLKLLIDPVYPAFSATGVYFAVTAFLFLSTDRERRFIRQAFHRYLAPELLAKLEAKPEALKLGGEIRDMTILFLDIRDFTQISEQLSPEALVRFLNTLFSPLTEAILSEKGVVDKYIGDSIMAFWNAPLDDPDHTRHACLAALKMRNLVHQMNESDAFGLRARELNVQIGIGINTGAACVGNMGSENRFNYSVIGDTVNAAARIEASCKQVGAPILISAETAKAVPDFAVLEAGFVHLKGKSAPLRLFALIGDQTIALTEEFQNLAREHARMVRAIEARDGPEALNALLSCRLLAGKSLSGFYDYFFEGVRSLSSGDLPHKDEMNSQPGAV